VVIGEYTEDKDGNVICKCGRKDNFKLASHIDMVDKAVSNYQCQNCGNVITIETKRDTSWW